MHKLVLPLLFLAIVVEVHPLYADVITYDFSGAMAFNGTRGPIVNDTPVVGSFTLDLTAAGQTTADPQTTDYPQSLPPADFLLTVSGLTLKVSTFDASITVGSPQELLLDATGSWTTAPGWAYTPDAGAVTENRIAFNTLANMFSDLAHLPDLGQFAPLNGKHIFLSFGAGSYTYPGGSFTVPENDETHFTITSLSRVPEPSSVVLGALGFASLAAWGWRRPKAVGASRN